MKMCMIILRFHDNRCSALWARYVSVDCSSMFFFADGFLYAVMGVVQCHLILYRDELLRG